MQSPHSATSTLPAEHRRHARVAASWPVTVQTGTRILHLHAVNVSALGVKVSLDEPLLREPLEVGRPAHLRIEPPGRAAGGGRGDRVARGRRRARVLLHRPAGVVDSPLSHEEIAMGAEARIKELGITLPNPPKPMGNYVPGVRTGNLLFLSGHGPIRIEGNPSARGKVGRDLSTEDAYKVAREVGINLLGSARALLGSLDRVKRVVKVLGMVNAVESFGEQPKVINGFSDLMVEVFGENGRHARSAVGMGSLPAGIPVEIEMILEVGAAGAPKARKPARAARPAARKPKRRR